MNRSRPFKTWSSSPPPRWHYPTRRRCPPRWRWPLRKWGCGRQRLRDDRFLKLTKDCRCLPKSGRRLAIFFLEMMTDAPPIHDPNLGRSRIGYGWPERSHTVVWLAKKPYPIQLRQQMPHMVLGRPSVARVSPLHRESSVLVDGETAHIRSESAHRARLDNHARRRRMRTALGREGRLWFSANGFTGLHARRECQRGDKHVPNRHGPPHRPRKTPIASNRPFRQKKG